MILRSFFEYKKSPGFYIDIGAHHPKRFSNTYYFYQNGWRGINIDARPGCMKLFNILRPKDINIEAAVSNEHNELTYYMFNEPAINTFDKLKAEEIEARGIYSLIKEATIETTTIKKILKDNLPAGQEINFLNIDAEGYDLKILKSIDFSAYSPEIIVIEDKEFNITSLHKSEIHNYLAERDYILFTKTSRNSFYKQKKDLG